MTEEVFVQLFWAIALVVGLMSSLVGLAALGEWLRRRSDHHFPEWDWHADLKRRVTDQGKRQQWGGR